MLYFVIFCGLLLLFFFKAYNDRKADREILKRRLEQEWGQPVRGEYGDRVWKNIGSYFQKKRNKDSVDDITWNDLNLSEIYQRMNHTRTSAGEAVLYRTLRTPLFGEEELWHRERVISGLQERKAERDKLEEALLRIGKVDDVPVYEWLLKVETLKPFSGGKHIFHALLLTAGTVLLGFLPLWYMIVFLFLLIFNTFFYFQEKGRHFDDILLLKFVLRMIRGAEEIGKLSGKISFEALDEEVRKIQRLTKKFQKFERMHVLVFSGNDQSGSIVDSLFDYIRILFHLDLIKVATMIREVKRYEEELLALFEALGWLDAMLAVASYRESLAVYAVPQFSGEKFFEAKGLYHPLVEHPVKNDIEMKKSVLLTGSNASGKSTFLKAAAIGILFAQTIHTVAAESYQADFYHVLSSMALRDNILAKESYFVVEIKSLKRLFDAKKERKHPVFCFVDEILRGTNTVERVAASSAFLEFLSGREKEGEASDSSDACKKVLCMAATHDMELTEILEGIYENYHFEETVTDGDVSFDYLLKKGRAKSRNAILLMEGLGFDKKMISRAKELSGN